MVSTPVSGKLFLIPVPLSGDSLNTLAPEVLHQLHLLRHYIVENARTARRFIKTTNPPYSIESLHITELDKHGEIRPELLLRPAYEGHDMGILSEAGCPGIADPGSKLVQYAHEAGIRVIPLTGPSSILLALMASGMNGQGFQFHGYLSPKKPLLSRDLKRLEDLAESTGATQIFIETPYRNTQVVTSALADLKPLTLFCIAADLKSPTEYIHTASIATWRKMPLQDFHKRPAVFLIGKA